MSRGEWLAILSRIRIKTLWIRNEDDADPNIEQRGLPVGADQQTGTSTSRSVQRRTRDDLQSEKNPYQKEMQAKSKHL